MLTAFSNLNAQSYKDLWNDVNKNLDNRLPQSAETILNKIEEKAINENNQKELLKSYLYRFEIFKLSEEEAVEASINFATENITNLQEPERAIFNIAIASLYETYMIFNNHIIKNNIPIVNSQQLIANSLNMKFWDEATFKRVINNIVNNSVKYMDKPQGAIEIRILDEIDSIRVEIEDNGRGIAAKDLGRIFERFYRTDASRNSSKGGSGIGLSIVKKIIEDHGGYIWATSKEGEGTCMHFVIRKYREVDKDE